VTQLHNHVRTKKPFFTQATNVSQLTQQQRKPYINSQQTNI